MLSDIAGAEGPIYSSPSLLSPRGILSALRNTEVTALVTRCATALSKSALPLPKKSFAIRIDRFSQAVVSFQLLSKLAVPPEGW